MNFSRSFIHIQKMDKRGKAIICHECKKNRVGLAGFEPATSASRTQRSTKLSHSPQVIENKAIPAPAQGWSF